MDKGNILILIAAALIACAVGVVSYFIGGKTATIDDRARPEFSAAADVNRQLETEQRAALGGIANSAARVNRSAEAIERIRGINQEADAALRELGESNRRASDISAQIREEVNLLADYFRSINNIIDDYDRNIGGN